MNTNDNCRLTTLETEIDWKLVQMVSVGLVGKTYLWWLQLRKFCGRFHPNRCGYKVSLDAHGWHRVLMPHLCCDLLLLKPSDRGSVELYDTRNHAGYYRGTNEPDWHVISINEAF